MYVLSFVSQQQQQQRQQRLFEKGQWLFIATLAEMPYFKTNSKK